ncbi:MAG: PE domain-containing protein [Candidatus Nanopelagicales bacterium]
MPAYVREIARSVEKTGKSLSQAIAIAISRIKVWAAGGDKVSKKTQAKAAKALAEWEALKAKNKARGAKDKVKASNWVEDLEAEADLVRLSVADDLVLRLAVERNVDTGALALSKVLLSASNRS